MDGVCVFKGCICESFGLLVVVMVEGERKGGREFYDVYFDKVYERIWEVFEVFLGFC